MQIEERQSGSVMILDLTGKLTIVRRARRAAEGQDQQRFSTRGTGTCCSTWRKSRTSTAPGLGQQMVSTLHTVNRQGGKLKLLNLTERIEDLLSITKLLTVFDAFDNEQEALDSFS